MMACFDTLLDSVLTPDGLAVNMQLGIYNPLWIYTRMKCGEVGDRLIKGCLEPLDQSCAVFVFVILLGFPDCNKKDCKLKRQ